MDLNNVIKFTIPVTAAIALTMATSVSASDGETIYNKACKMCHAQGMMKAPKVGNNDAWKDRIAKGMDTLYDHALNGFKDIGVMPARGGKKNLTDDEVKSAVDYMVEHSK